jgi:ATP-dependent helicase/nuclease subunit B
VRTADTDWDAAPATARMLHELSGAQRTHTVLSTQSTGLLDRELIRIGDVPVGVRSRHTSPLGEIIPVFLRAMTAPHDVHAIVDLLNVKIPHQVPWEKDVPATYRTTMTPIVPKPLHRELSEALNTQPGVGGSAWEKATETALENTGDRPGDAEHIQEFDRLIRTSPLRDHADDDELGTGFDTAAIDAHLEWLRLQFTRYIRDDNEISHVTGQIDRIVDLVSALGARVSAKELDQIISAVTVTGGLDTDSELSPDRDVVTNPGQLGRGTAPVVWWLPVDDSPVLHEHLRPAEITWLTQVGVDLPAREMTARLTLDSQLRALRRRGHVTVILPERVNGEAATEHPTLAFLRHDLQTQGRTVDTGAAALPETRSVVPETMPLAQPDPTYREFTPDISLLPSGASFSQWEKLLLHPLEWLLGRRLGIEGGSLADVPTGNRMIGTWLHAVVEEIVNHQLDENDGAPVTAHATPDEVTERLVATAPHYASELLLDGRQREYGATLAIARQSITGLFTALADDGIRITAVEAKIDAGVTGCHGAEGPEKELPLRGFRDMDVIMADGTPGVIDLKYTLAKKKYRELIESGTALQLAVYAKSVAAEHALATLAEVPVAYFSLHDNRFDTADERFLDTGGPTHGDVLQVNASDNGGADADELWQRAVAGLNTVINDLRKGRVVDLGNLVNNPDWQRFENPKKGEAPASPYDEETTDAFQRDLEWMRNTGFFPEDNAKYTEFSLITGASGDFA